MMLQKLEIEIERWGENKGKYKGAIKFGDERGIHASQRRVAICGYA